MLGSLINGMFSAFSPLNGGGPETYYQDNEYPYDLNGSLDYTRPQTGFSPFPYPLSIPHVEGLIPLFDTLQFSMMDGKLPYGPFMTQGQGYNFDYIFPSINGAGDGRLKKVSG